MKFLKKQKSSKLFFFKHFKRIVDFFEILNACISACEFENQEFYFSFKKVQKRFVVASSLYQNNFKYFSTYFTSNVEDLTKFAWFLFLSLEDSFPNWLLDFYTSQKIFACMVLFLWKVVPENSKSKLESTSFFKI
jgi:hypothetical protein